MMMDGDYDENITQTVSLHIFSNLPNDILVELVSWFPAKSILRFRSVCKTWLTLFSDPDFIKLHLDHTAINQEGEEYEYLIVQSIDTHTTTAFDHTSILHINSPNTRLNLNLSFQKSSCRMNLVGSINGLVCLSCGYDSKCIVLGNPVTKQCKYLPHSTIKPHAETVLNISIGFCFDSHMNNYIFVRFKRYRENMIVRTRAEFYFLNSDSWGETELGEVNFLILSSKCDTIVKGEPYWWTRHTNGSRRFVMRFDIYDKIFRRVPRLRLPQHEDVEKFKLVNYKSSLAVLVDSTLSLSSLTCEYLGLGLLKREGSDRTISLLVLDSDRSWHVGFRVGFPGMIERMIGCSKNGQIVLEDKLKKMVLFDPIKVETESTNIVGGMARSFVVIDYAPTFIPIKGSKRVIRPKNKDS